jgi:spermidine/putrescine transport system substrate-binding protein
MRVCIGSWAGSTIFAILTLLLCQAVAVAADVRLLTWADYISPQVIVRFETETGHRVILDTFLSNKEMRDKLRAGTVYDILTPADHDVPDLVRLGLLDSIDASHLSGYANILDGWRSPPYDPKNEWSVPLHWGISSFVVDTDVYSGPIDSYRLLFDPPPELRDRVGFLIGAEETLRMAFLWLGLPQCTSDRAQLAKVIDAIRPVIGRERIYTISTATTALSQGRIAIGVAWNGDALRAREIKPSLRFAYPREGLVVWSDALSVVKGSPNREAAIAFINFMLQPANIAEQSNFTRYANVIRGSEGWMDQSLLDAPEVVVPSGAKLRFFRSCGSEQIGLYSEMWDPLLQELAR